MLVQCATISDSNTEGRVMCGDTDSSDVCRTWGADVSEDCKALRAGCGPHRDSGAYRRGDKCNHPQWCNSSYYYQPPITTPKAYMDRIGHDYGEQWKKACKFRAEERPTFDATLHEYMSHYKRQHHDQWETEINMYGGPGDGGLQQALMQHLEALLYDRTMGVDVDLQALKQLQAHLRTLGKDVPIVEISMERPKSLHLWDDERLRPINLTEAPYGMRLVE